MAIYIDSVVTFSMTLCFASIITSNDDHLQNIIIDNYYTGKDNISQ